jgi:hypothetical protein
MSGVGLRINASVGMQPESDLPGAKQLRARAGPTISYRGKLFPGLVLACETPIDRGQTGEAIIGVIAESRDDVEMQAGSVFELLDGLNVIAYATVITVVYD